MSKADAVRKNRTRVANARSVLDYYSGGQPSDETLSDLLCDMLHAYGTNAVADALTEASMHYAAEVKPDDIASDPGFRVEPLPPTLGPWDARPDMAAKLRPGALIRVTKATHARRSGMAGYFCRVGDTYRVTEVPDSHLGVWIETPDRRDKWAWLGFDVCEVA